MDGRDKRDNDDGEDECNMIKEDEEFHMAASATDAGVKCGSKEAIRCENSNACEDAKEDTEKSQQQDPKTKLGWRLIEGEEGSAVDPYEDMQRFKNEVNPLPSGRRRRRRRPFQEGPGAYAVGSPLPFPPSISSLWNETSSTSITTATEFSEVPSSALFNVPATLSPLDGTNEDLESGGAITTKDVSTHRDDISFHTNDDMVLDAKIVPVEKGSFCPRLATRNLLYGMVCVLLAIVVVLALGLAGHLDLPQDSDIEIDLYNPSEFPNNTESVSLLEQIQERGYLKCHYANIPGFMYKNETTGEVTGFHAEWCKAIAAALFGLDGLESRIKYIDFYPINTDADVSSIGMTPTMARHVYFKWVETGMSFSTPVLYDGIRFAGEPYFVRCAQDSNYLNECADLMVCAQASSTHHDLANTLVSVRRISTFLKWEGAMKGFFNGECNVLITKQILSPESVLRSWGYEGNFTMGDESLGHESWSLVTRKGDARWADFVNAVVQSILVAEQHHITRATGYLFPRTQVFGEGYRNMFRHSVSAVGNIREVWEHTLGNMLGEILANEVNDGNTGLMLSYPFELSSSTRKEDYVPSRGPHLKRVLSRGHLLCGVQYNRPGFAIKQEDGVSTGMEIDACKGLAASLFGSDDALILVPIHGSAEGFQKLSKNEVDVIAGALWNLENDVNEPTTGRGFAFSQTYFYGQGEENLCLATLEDDADWSTVVFWFVTATIYAEEHGINQTNSNDMPTIHVFGSGLERMAKDAILAVGNYGDMYQQNLQSIIPRSGRNLMNANIQGPQHYPMPGLA